jgi:hypothetical protein
MSIADDRSSLIRVKMMFGWPTRSVLIAACRHLWQADDARNYNNKGFRLRGHIFTDAEGRYAFGTIMPGLDPGRTRHYHVKVQAPNRLVDHPVLFPRREGEPHRRFLPPRTREDRQCGRRAARAVRRGAGHEVTGEFDGWCARRELCPWSAQAPIGKTRRPAPERLDGGRRAEPAPVRPAPAAAIRRAGSRSEYRGGSTPPPCMAPKGSRKAIVSVHSHLSLPFAPSPRS